MSDPSGFHVRAKESAEKLRQNIVTISSAGVGFFYVVLAKADSFGIAEQIALTLFAASILTGLVAYLFDAQWSYWRAKRLDVVASKGEQVEHLGLIIRKTQMIDVTDVRKRELRYLSARLRLDVASPCVFASAVLAAVLCVM